MAPDKQARVSESVYELAAAAKTWKIASELLWAAVPDQMFMYAHIFEHNWHARRLTATYIN